MKKVLIVLLSLNAYAEYPLESTFYSGFVCNQVMARENFYAINRGVKKVGVIMVDGNFNTGPWFVAAFKKKLSNNIYTFINVDFGIEWKAQLMIHSSIALNPVGDFTKYLNGDMWANFFVFNIGLGKEFEINDKLKLSTSLSYFHDNVYRSILFSNIERGDADYKYVLYDYYNAPRLGLGATYSTNGISTTGKFLYALSNFNVNLYRYNQCDQLQYNFPLASSWKMSLSQDYEINECSKIGYELAWALKKALKNGSVVLPASETVFFDNFIPFLQTQYIFGLVTFSHSF